MLALARKIPQADRMTRDDQWKRIMGNDVWGKTLGIFGLGQIGFNVAKRAKGFDMNVIAYDLVQNLPLAGSWASNTKARRKSSGRRISSPCICRSIRKPGDLSVRRIESHEENRDPRQYLPRRDRRRKGALSGPEGGKIAGAALDVFEQEPPGKTPLVELDNFIGSPHIGGITIEAIDRIGMTVARDIVSVLKGQTPKFPANREWLAS